MKIAILGAGNIGGTLGKAWLAAGHEVVFGVRDPQSAKTQAAVEATGGKIPAKEMGEAARFGEVVLVAIPHAAVAEVVGQHASALAGKIILDASNNFGAPVVNNLAAIQARVPSATLYRAFNSIGWGIFADPKFGAQQADLFFSGPDGDRRARVEKLISEVGLRPIWVGENDLAPVVDALGTLWVTLVRQRGWPRRVAFKLLE